MSDHDVCEQATELLLLLVLYFCWTPSPLSCGARASRRDWTRIGPEEWTAEPSGSVAGGGDAMVPSFGDGRKDWECGVCILCRLNVSWSNTRKKDGQKTKKELSD